MDSWTEAELQDMETVERKAERRPHTHYCR